jgi:two-component system OmpR family sensor kinase
MFAKMEEVPEARPATQKLLQMLEQLLAVDVADLKSALTHSCNLVAEALRADKVDAFLYEPSNDSLVALSTSTQPLSALQKKLGLDVLPVSNGGRVVYVYDTGKTFVTGALDEDPDELKGVKQALKIRSKLGVPLQVNGRRSGMMMIASLQPHFFTAEDVRFAEAIVRWVSIVAHKAELAAEITRNSVEQGRRAAADEIITIVAHDLRNFLAPLGARLHLLSRRAKKDGRETDEQHAEAGLRVLSRLNRLISDLLDLSRLDQGVLKLDLQPLDLARLAEEVGGTLATPEHQVAVDCYEQVLVAADTDRLRQCLENVISNAIRHSPKNASVTVLISREKGEDREWVRLEVRDQGPGIPEHMLSRIFERFAAGPDSPGLGLGLYLARRIAVAHGGDLTAESPPGAGARFILRLPFTGEP